MLRDVHHGKRCPYCDRTMSSRDVRLHPTRDHVIPKCRNGREKIICCQTCNGTKADMTPEQWADFRAAHPSWWLLTRLELRLIHRKARGLRTTARLRRRPIVVPPALIFRASQLGNREELS